MAEADKLLSVGENRLLPAVADTGLPVEFLADWAGKDPACGFGESCRPAVEYNGYT